MRKIRRLLVLQHIEIEGSGLFEQFAREQAFLNRNFD